MLKSLAPFTSPSERIAQFGSNPQFSSASSPGKNTNHHSDNRHSANGFDVFNSILQNAYRQLAITADSKPSTAPQPELDQYTSVDKTSSQQAADTILGFIGRQIQTDAANGASKDELLNRLNEGLKGFNRGFNQAKDQIEALGLLNPELSGEINDTYERVTQGIEQLRQGITGEPIKTEASSQLHIGAQTSQSSSFSLSLTTQDGDQVNIEISRASQSGYSVDVARNSNASSITTEQHSSASNTFSLEVTGDLDAGELAAINQLLEDIDVIATDFFAGRYTEAFEQSLSLDLDKEELNKLDLQLQQTTTSQAMAAYQSTSQNEQASHNKARTASAVSELNHLLNGLKSLQEQANNFDRPTSLIKDLSSGISQMNQPSSVAQNTSELGNKLSSLVSQFQL